MVVIKSYLNDIDKSGAKGVSHKNLLSKRSVIIYMVVNGACTLLDLASELSMSIPTVTKLVSELLDDNIIVDYGKVETTGGRRPNLYGLTQSSICFAGVDVSYRHISFVVTNLNNEIIDIKRFEPFALTNTPECLDELCVKITNYINGLDIDSDKILGIGVSLSGRINSNSGSSYHYFNNTSKPLSEILEERTGFKVLIENDTRASCYAEYTHDQTGNISNMVYLYMSRGIAAGIIIDSKLYYGKSGFAGEFGHIPLFDNDIICQCGKKGCLETEVSGIALERIMNQRIEEGSTTILSPKYDRGEPILMNDIIAAAKNDDVLSIELIENMGEDVGRAISILINIFNPELFVVGGGMSSAGDYLMLSLKSAVNKYSASLVHKDTVFRISKLGDDAALLGVAMLIRKKILGI